MVVVGDIGVGADELNCRGKKKDGLLRNGGVILILATCGLEYIHIMNYSRVPKIQHQVQT